MQLPLNSNPRMLSLAKLRYDINEIKRQTFLKWEIISKEIISGRKGKFGMNLRGRTEELDKRSYEIVKKYIMN
jgi:hypothetical protein